MRKNIFYLVVLAALMLTAACNLTARAVPQAAPTVAEPTSQPPPTTAQPLTPTALPASPTAPAPAATAAPPTATPSPTPPAPPSATPTESLPPLAHLTPQQALVIHYIRMLDATTGWATATGWATTATDPTYHILSTTDGGQTFRDVTPPEPQSTDPASAKYASAYFADAQTAWVTYYNGPGGYPVPAAPVVWRTTDAGLTWQASQPVPTAGLDEYLPSTFFFLDATHGWLLTHLGAGMGHDYFTLFHTADGGQTWTMQIDPFGLDDPGLQSCQKTGLAFANPLDGWLTRDCFGMIDGIALARTQDGGETWALQDMPAPASLPDLFRKAYCGVYSPTFNPLTAFFPSGLGVVGVRCRDFNDTEKTYNFLYASTDRGETWAATPYPGGDLLFLDEQQGWALGGEIHFTQDGGKTWARLNTVSWAGQFTFPDAQHGWAVATAYDASGNYEIALVNTTNGGKKWGILQPVIAP